MLTLSCLLALAALVFAVVAVLKGGTWSGVSGLLGIAIILLAALALVRCVPLT